MIMRRMGAVIPPPVVAEPLTGPEIPVLVPVPNLPLPGTPIPGPIGNVSKPGPGQ